MACVTLAGETLRGSMVEGGRGVKGLLAPRREIREISVRQEQVEAILRDARDRGLVASTRADAAFAETRALEERIHAAEKDLVALRHDLATAEEEMARLQRKQAVLDIERSQAEQERGAAAVRMAEIEQGLAAAERDREEGSRRLAAMTAAVAEARAASEAAQVRSSEAKSVLAALRERAAATEAECRRLEQDHRDLTERIAAADRRAEEMDVRRGELRAEMAEAERLLAEALGARERVSGEAAVAEDRVRDLRNELEGREAGLKERRRERDMLRDALGELEVARARTGSDLDHLGRECHQAVGMMAAEAAALITEEDRAQELSGLEVQVQEMRDRLERLGPVNVLAFEEHKEMSERLTFLTTQRDDLLKSIAELQESIRKINATSSERLRRGVPGDQRELQGRFPPPLPGRRGRDEAARRDRRAGISASRSTAQPRRQAQPVDPPALGRREGADGDRRSCSRSSGTSPRPSASSTRWTRRSTRPTSTVSRACSRSSRSRPSSC